MPPTQTLLLFLSFASGMAALIYETAWLQSLELVIGSSAVSLGILLASFMGGNCLGSLLFTRFRLSNPVRLYAKLEIGIGALAITLLAVMPLVGRVYVASAANSGGLLWRGIAAALCLLPPALLMGATLPALAVLTEVRSNLGALYAANVFGAVAGCLLTGFYLLRLYDVATATYVAAGINGIAAGLAYWLSSHQARAASIPDDPPSPKASGNTPIYLTIAFSGFCALAAETVWTRTLGLMFGASVYTFSLVLAVFLTGLGIGSGLGARLSRNRIPPRGLLALCQLLVAPAIAWAAYSSTGSLLRASTVQLETAGIWTLFSLDFGRALIMLLPATVLWGATFPLALACAKGADRMAQLLAANTFGAILGALVASLVLIGSLGSQRTQQALIAVAATSAILLLERSRKSALFGISGLAIAGLSLYLVPPIPGVLIAHGRFASSWEGKGEIVYAAEGRNSPVAVTRFSDGSITFHVAGKIQASSVPRDMRLQRMLGHLTTLAPASPRSVLVIGCGAGVTAGAVAIDPAVERVTIAEIEPLVPQIAETWFGQQNFDMLRFPKVHVRIDDGRHFLLTSKEQFDAITADPLDPWVKGAANLYTLEMFRAMREHLRPGGAVTMYIQLFETNIDAVKSALATFFSVFPNGTVWGNTNEGKGYDMVLLGQVEPLHVDLDAMEKRFAPVAESLAEVGMYSPTDLFATYAGRAADLKPWLKSATINRDGNLRMQYLAGLGLNRDDAAAIYSDLLTHRRFPEGMFSGSEGRMNSIRLALLR